MLYGLHYDCDSVASVPSPIGVSQYFVLRVLLCAVQLAKKTTFLAREYILPDGQRIRLTTERFQAAEVIFNPGALGHENAGLSEAVYACINDLPIDVRRDMYETILMGGGTMMLPGLSTRLQRDLETMYLDRVLQVRCAFLLLQWFLQPLSEISLSTAITQIYYHHQSTEKLYRFPAWGAWPSQVPL